jgi:hypothetical protein
VLLIVPETALLPLFDKPEAPWLWLVPAPVFDATVEPVAVVVPVEVKAGRFVAVKLWVEFPTAVAPEVLLPRRKTWALISGTTAPDIEPATRV